MGIYHDLRDEQTEVDIVIAGGKPLLWKKCELPTDSVALQAGQQHVFLPVASQPPIHRWRSS